MNYQTNSYGTNRDNKRNISCVTLGILTVCLLIISACTPILPTSEEKGQEFQGSIEDWSESDAITAPSDSVRPATHQDSIRFGIIPPDA